MPLPLLAAAPLLAGAKGLLFKFWREIAIVVLVIASVGGIYHIGKTAGERQAQAACVEKFQAYQTALDNKIAAVSDQITLLAIARDKGTALTKSDLDKIYTEIRERKLIVVENGKCSLTPDFQKSYNEIIERANKK